MLKSKFLFLILIFGSIAILSQCSEEEKPLVKEYLNWSDSARYVGINTCKQCHYEIYNSYVKTGMGSSFGLAHSNKSIAQTNPSKLLVDSNLNLNYSVYWKDDSLFIKEFRIGIDLDTIHSLKQKIEFIVGSGQHTNSHMFLLDSHLYQAPFTWYAQNGILDFPPGYDDGNNLRFDRKIGLECTSCHNSIPTAFKKGSINKYSKIPQAIDCERCHGPGSIHVQRIQQGVLVDTANEIDYSIVNPGKLSAQLQMELCQRCHLQGNAVLAEEADFRDFKPGKHLKEYMDVYLPRFEGADEKFIMASHADRLKLSECFKSAEGSFNCISCHNPHISVKETNIINFNNQCASCHGVSTEVVCSEEHELRLEVSDNCVQCHMPSSGSTDIPHVSVHDHFIRVPEPSEIDQAKKMVKFLGLSAINNSEPSNYSLAMAYLQQFEKFEPRPFYLDSAWIYILKVGEPGSSLKLKVYYHFLKNDFESISQIVAENQGKEINDDYSNYRIAQANYKLENFNEALNHIEIAIEISPYIEEFYSLQAKIFIALSDFKKAELAAKRGLKENSHDKDLLNNLGFAQLMEGKVEEAQRNFEKAISYDPNYIQAYFNLAQVELIKDDLVKAVYYLDRILTIAPNNTKAIQAKLKIDEKV